MRKAERIRPFLENIAKTWESRVPDWRFGQIMFNFLSEVGDPFHWEDDLFLEKLNKFLEANT